jgi:hypothetical protein
MHEQFVVANSTPEIVRAFHGCAYREIHSQPVVKRGLRMFALPQHMNIAGYTEARRFS